MGTGYAALDNPRPWRHGDDAPHGTCLGEGRCPAAHGADGLARRSYFNVLTHIFGFLRASPELCGGGRTATRVRLLRRFRQIKQELPDRNDLNGSGVDFDPLAFRPSHNGRGLDLQLAHGLAERGHLAFARLRFGERFAYLNQDGGSRACRHDEIDLSAGGGFVIKYLREYAPQRREDHVFQKMAGVDHYPRR